MPGSSTATRPALAVLSDGRGPGRTRAEPPMGANPGRPERNACRTRMGIMWADSGRELWAASAGQEFLGLDGVAAAPTAAGAEGLLVDGSDGRAPLVSCRRRLPEGLGAWAPAMWWTPYCPVRVRGPLHRLPFGGRRRHWPRRGRQPIPVRPRVMCWDREPLGRRARYHRRPDLLSDLALLLFQLEGIWRRTPVSWPG